MSELKAHDLVDIQDYRGEVYLKSEADKVIAEKDNELRHQKYKRCLAMARWCQLELDQWIDGSLRWQRWNKWYWRWHKLAEQFKPNY